MNSSLLAKWRWKLLTEDNDLWKKVVAAKYGANVFGKVKLDADEYRSFGSGWWRDICRVDDGLGWFAQVASKKVGNGRNTSFWKEVWLGESSLASRFPRLFGISNQSEAVVSEVGRWENGVWRWRLEWRRRFFVWEEELYQDLLDVLALATISFVDDRWVWNPGLEEGFSVKSTYVFLDHTINIRSPLSSLLSFAFNFIWKSGVPSKVCALAWQVLLDRAPTRDNLRRRGVVSMEGALCPLCNEEVETACHLFLHCRKTAMIWYDLYRWLGVVSVLSPSVPMSYAVMVGCGSNKKRRKGFSIIWLASLWVLWNARNDVVFNNALFDGPKVVDSIKRVSWQWFVNNTAKGPVLLYEWEWEPGDCMLR
jgi:hypothetical protein